MSKSFHFQGTLEETYLADMLWSIYRYKVPGVLEISNSSGVSKKIYVNEGSVIHASSSDPIDRLGPFLLRAGRLSQEALDRTQRQVESTGRRHGQVLIEEGIMSPGDLYRAIRAQVEAIVWSLFSWTEGRVTFRLGQEEDPLMIKIHLPMRQVIVRGIKKVKRTRGLVTRLGNKETVFRPSYDAEDLIEIALGSEEYKLLSQVDGQRNFYDVCSDGSFGMSENARLLYAFRVLQLIEAVDPADAD